MDILEIFVRNWDPKIGDPSPMGWVTVVAYFGAAALLAWNWRVAPRIYKESLKVHQLVLICFMLVMLGLGVNKQLDVQTWLTKVGRDISKAQGWWENRRVAQAVVLAGLLLAGLGLAAFTLRARGVVRAHRLALLGFLFVISFVIMRASSFFQMDQLINHRVFGFRMNWFLELTGIGIIALSAWRNVLRSRSAESVDVEEEQRSDAEELLS